MMTPCLLKIRTCSIPSCWPTFSIIFSTSSRRECSIAWRVLRRTVFASRRVLAFASEKISSRWLFAAK
jgi:hypothetical protein